MGYIINRHRMIDRQEECECEHCGSPLMVSDMVYEIQDHEFYGFCNKVCVKFYIQEHEGRELTC